MKRHLTAAAAGLFALVSLWHLAALGALFLIREARPPKGPSLGEIGTDDPQALIDLVTDHPWNWAAIGALAGAAVVAGLVLASGRLSPVLGLVAGPPIAGAGVAGVLSPDTAKAVAEGPPAFGASAAFDGDTSDGALLFLLDGTFLLLGAALTVAALTALRAPRRRPLPFWAGVPLGLVLAVAAWAVFTLIPAHSPGVRAALVAGAGAVLGYTAGSRFPPRTATLVAGLPPLVLGVWGLLDFTALLWVANRLFPLEYDLGAGDEAVFDLLARRDAVTTGGDVFLLLGGALVVAALAPWRRVPRVPPPHERGGAPVPRSAQSV